MTDRAHFEALDAADPLAALRDALTLPPGVRYFDGNSLGPQPKTARTAVLRVLEQGWGEALIGGILLGGISSISGIMTSVTAAWSGHPDLSFSNAIGGIAAQTTFLAIADLTYRRANLEHASASLSNLMQGILLILMLTFALFTLFVPNFSIWHVHPASFILLGIYAFGTRLISQAQKQPMWRPIRTQETVEDEPDATLPDDSRQKIYLRFVLSAIIVGVAGYFVAKVAVSLSNLSGLSQSFVGALFTSVATSLPELVISVSAVRQKALTLAVANIIGGNSFDVLFVAFSDFAYQGGSIYHAVGQEQAFILSLSVLLSGVLLMGMLHRQREGIANAGWESITTIVLFLAGYAMLYTL